MQFYRVLNGLYKKFIRTRILLTFFANNSQANRLEICNTTVEKLHIPQSTVSQHLGILKVRGIVNFRKKGVETCYVLGDERIRRILEIMG